MIGSIASIYALYDSFKSVSANSLNIKGDANIVKSKQVEDSSEPQNSTNKANIDGNHNNVNLVQGNVSNITLSPDYFVQENSNKDLFKTFPISIGDERDIVSTKIGPAQETFDILEFYYSYGVAIYYDRYTNKVNAFGVGAPNEGVFFDGLIDGIKLGDSANKVVEQWKSPYNWGVPIGNHKLMLWYDEASDYFKMAAILKKVNLEQAAETPFMLKPNSVVLMAKGQRSSLAFIDAIVAIFVQEIRAGISPSFLQKNPMSNVSLDDEDFNGSYHITRSYKGYFNGHFLDLVFVDDNNNINRRITLWIDYQAPLDSMIKSVLERDENDNLDLKKIVEDRVFKN